MDQEGKVAPKETPVKETSPSDIPDRERRKIIRKLVTGAFVAPLALLVLDGGDSITYGY